jgi:Leucine-rich repeat (LRR) protein
MVRINIDIITKGTTLRRKKDEDDDSLMKRVTHVNLSSKKIVQIENLECCQNLQCLYLYENRIKQIQNLDFAVHLTHLYLQENNIVIMQNLEHLISLRKLFLGGNSIQEITGLTRCNLLQELHAQAQNLPGGESMYFDTASLQAISDSLQVLNVQKNNIREISPLRLLHNIEKLDLSMNNVESFEEVGSLFRHNCCTNMTSLEMKGNPVDKQHRFRDYIIMMTSNLTSLNGRDITQTERQFIMNREAAKHQARSHNSVGDAAGNGADAFDGVQVGDKEQGWESWQQRVRMRRGLPQSQ